MLWFWQRPDSGKPPKVVRRGCKRSFGAREQKSQKGLLHHQNLVLHRCNPAFHRCKRDLARLHPKAFCTLSQPLWGDFPESGDLPGPQLPNLRMKNPQGLLGWGSRRSHQHMSFNRTRQKHSGAHFCLKRYKTRCTPEKRDRIKNPRHGQHPERDQNEIGTRYEVA